MTSYLPPPLLSSPFLPSSRSPYTSVVLILFSRFQDKGLSQLLALLHKTKKELRAYSHVNKKALDQYVHFKEQRESLEERRTELDESEKAIQELIAALDEKKGQAIERTFKIVAKFFSVVFAELTGDGIFLTCFES
jgi:structural maintenance of chromosome 3 (chondroitin sulfate proteoglycan 6)